MNYEFLIKAAIEAAEFAHAPYSHFPVGAALLTETGEVITGCNIESSSFGLTVCAERVACFKAYSEGRPRFKAIAIVSRSNQLCPPCGACRQVLWDLAGDIDVVLSDGTLKVFKLSALLPEAFDEGILPHD